MDTLLRLNTALSARYDIQREWGPAEWRPCTSPEDLRHRRKVAIKVLREELSASAGSACFFREIEIAGDKRFYFVIDDRQSNVWVAELVRE